MIDQIILWSIRRRWLVVGLASLILVAGLLALYVAPIDAIPDLSENQIIVHAEWPGHGPSEIQEQITSPLTRTLLGVSGVKTVRSSSDVGSASLWVIFDDNVAIQTARRSLIDRLVDSADTLKLPEGVAAKLAPAGPATGQIFWYTLESQTLTLADLRTIQDQLIKPALAAVPGVAEVASVGGMVAELVVEADPLKLQKNRVDLLDLAEAVRQSGSMTGAGVVQKANAEFLIRSVNSVGQGGNPQADLLNLIVPTIDGTTVLLSDVAEIMPAPAPRRGALEKDGQEVCGGVVLMAYGENPLQLTTRLKARLAELLPALPSGVKLTPVYDRTPLIQGGFQTVSRTIVEAMVVAGLCVILILRHIRAAFVVAVTLPLSVLASFLVLDVMRRLHFADIPINIMSLAGLAISIGILVDSAIVMTENVLHRLHERFGSDPVQGDISSLVGQACLQVGRPMIYAITIMLLSFLPIFALGGMEGKMFRPLAITKSLAMLTSAGLAITLVPALSVILVRGRAHGESSSRLVCSVTSVYRPILDYLLDQPGPLVLVIAVTALLAAAAVGNHSIFLGVLATSLIATGFSCHDWRWRAWNLVSLVLFSLVLDTRVTPIGHAFLTPLDEGMVMDMPISVPRVSIVQGIDDLKQRDMVLCRFPEVAMVVGKLGRAETPTDPAPLDMIESMVELHPPQYWPERLLAESTANEYSATVTDRLIRDGLLNKVTNSELLSIASSARERLHVQLREFAFLRNRELFRLPEFEESSWRIHGLKKQAQSRWHHHVRTLNADLRQRASPLFTRLLIEEAISRCETSDPKVTEYSQKLSAYRNRAATAPHHSQTSAHSSHEMSRTARAPSDLPLLPALEIIVEELTGNSSKDLGLRRIRREELIGFSGALDQALQMPGWTNVWTMPIQNRVDMLSTGVNTTIGIGVLGHTLDAVVETSEAVAKLVKSIPGATGVVCDPVRGKGTVEVRTNREQAARLGVRVGDVDHILETAMGGTVATTAKLDGNRVPVRVRYARSERQDEESVARVLVRSRPPNSEGRAELIPLADVAKIAVVNGPATIKGENGDLRNYVRLNVKERELGEFLAEARNRINREVSLPPGCRIEWTGQFEQEIRARRSLSMIIPLVILVIAGLLYVTFGDIADAGLILLCIPGVMCGGIAFQWFLGTPLSVTVWVGYVACFGMATATGVIMIVYLRDAIDRAGGMVALDQISLRTSVLDGAAHRLRPKLLTELTTVVGLIPLLLAGGVGSEVVRPMVAPVLGGILVADEVIDLLLPILFYRVRLWRMMNSKPKSQPPETNLAAFAKDNDRSHSAC